jgi:nitroreductase
MAADIDLFEAIFTCRAMRRLKPDPVPEDLLLKLVEAGHQGPTGSNLQSGRWVIVRDRELIASIGELNRRTMSAYIAPAGGRPTALPHQDAARRKRMLDAVVWQGEHYAEIPALIVPCLPVGRAARKSFTDGLDAGGSMWPGVQNVLLAARGLGLGAALTTFPLEDRVAFKALLGIPEGVEPLCVIPVGYPMGNFGPLGRRPLAEIVRWDRWSE